MGGNPMDVGLLLIATTKTGDLAEIARSRERAGFESLWIPEDPIIPIGFSSRPVLPGPLPEHYGRWLDPFIALTVAASATTRLRLAPGGSPPPPRGPAVPPEGGP